MNARSATIINRAAGAIAVKHIAGRDLPVGQVRHVTVRVRDHLKQLWYNTPRPKRNALRKRLEREARQ